MVDIHDIRQCTLMPGTKRLNLKLTKVKFAFELSFN